MTRRSLAAAATVAASLLLAPSSATAQRGEAGAGASIAGQIGFLVGNQGYGDFATGFRGGYTFPFHLYLGGDLTLYVAGAAFFSLAPEVGYDIGVTRSFVIRPYGGLGFVDFPNGAFRDNLAFEFYPGCEFLYYVTRGFFLGGDLRIPLLFVPGDNVVGLNLMFTLGYKW
jgi:hypothetical protein